MNSKAVLAEAVQVRDQVNDQVNDQADDQVNNQADDQVNDRINDQVNDPQEAKRKPQTADEAARAKAAFMANMSHELRTPLNAIVGFTDLLLLDESLTPEQEESVEIIRSSGEALLLLINDILDFADAERGSMRLKEQPFDLLGCIEASLDLVESKAVEKGLKLSMTIDEGTPRMICGDEARLRQILGNLLENAVKFTEKGEVTLSVSSRLCGLNHEVHFAVNDTGIGIPSDRMCRLFQPFSQVDDSMSRRYTGIGLGLAMSKRLVERMGGRIWAESRPGFGSTFHFTIRAETISDRYGLSSIQHGATKSPIMCSNINCITHGPQAAAQGLDGCWRF